jgi:hypothetical protein
MNLGEDHVRLVVEPVVVVGFVVGFGIMTFIPRKRVLSESCNLFGWLGYLIEPSDDYCWSGRCLCIKLDCLSLSLCHRCCLARQSARRIAATNDPEVSHVSIVLVNEGRSQNGNSS